MLEIQKAISEVNPFSGLLGRLDTAEQGINEHEDRSIKIVHTELCCQKQCGKIEQTCKSCGQAV